MLFPYSIYCANIEDKPLAKVLESLRMNVNLMNAINIPDIYDYRLISIEDE